MTSTPPGPAAPADRAPRGPGPEYIQSLARGIDVIRAFDGTSKALGLSEVAARTGLTRATARRFLLTLAELGYVRTDGTGYSLTARVLDIGYSYLSSASLPQLAEPRLEELVARVHESASLSVLDGGSIVYVARVAVSRIMTVGITIGTRFPAFCTSMGRVLLSGLPEDQLADFLAQGGFARRTSRTVTKPGELRRRIEQARRQGWAYVDQELEEGLSSVAAPVRDRHGDVVAAVNVSLSARLGAWDEVQGTVLPELLKTTAAIGEDLGRLGSSAVR